MRQQASTSVRLRLILQILFLLLSCGLLVVIILGFGAAIHGMCPYATVCFGFGSTGILSVVKGAFVFTIATGIAILIYTMFFGRKFCGYICPLGTYQEGIFAIRTLRYRRCHRFSYVYEKRFAKLKYLILMITIVLSLIGIGYLFIRLCPFYALSVLPRLAIPGLIVFAVITIAGLFMERFWCRFLCPYAALMNIFQAIGEWFGIKRSKIHRNLERCVDCGLCMLYCPMNLNIAEDEYVHSPDCIHCLVCASKCPKPGTFCCEKEQST